MVPHFFPGIPLWKHTQQVSFAAGRQLRCRHLDYLFHHRAVPPSHSLNVFYFNPPCKERCYSWNSVKTAPSEPSRWSSRAWSNTSDAKRKTGKVFDRMAQEHKRRSLMPLMGTLLFHRSGRITVEPRKQLPLWFLRYNKAGRKIGKWWIYPLQTMCWVLKAASGSPCLLLILKRVCCVFQRLTSAVARQAAGNTSKNAAIPKQGKISGAFLWFFGFQFLPVPFLLHPIRMHSTVCVVVTFSAEHRSESTTFCVHLSTIF